MRQARLDAQGPQSRPPRADIPEILAQEGYGSGSVLSLVENVRRILGSDNNEPYMIEAKRRRTATLNQEASFLAEACASLDSFAQELSEEGFHPPSAELEYFKELLKE